MRTWAEWNDAVPGFVEIDLVGHEGGNSSGERDRVGALETDGMQYSTISKTER